MDRSTSRRWRRWLVCAHEHLLVKRIGCVLMLCILFVLGKCMCAIQVLGWRGHHHARQSARRYMMARWVNLQRSHDTVPGHAPDPRACMQCLVDYRTLHTSLRQGSVCHTGRSTQDPGNLWADSPSCTLSTHGALLLRSDVRRCNPCCRLQHWQSYSDVSCVLHEHFQRVQVSTTVVLI